MTEREQEESQAQQDAADEIRSALAAGFAFVRSREVVASVAAISFEESVDSAIKDIETDESDIRVSKLTAVRQMRQELVDAVDRARRMPPEMFETRSTQGAANTTIDGDGPSSYGDEGEVE